VINDRETERIPQTLIDRQPGMLMTESQAGAQPFAPGGTVHILVEMGIEIMFDALLLQPANGATWFATGLEQFENHGIGQRWMDPFEVGSGSECNRLLRFQECYGRGR
jgi:hypothetical protein